MESIESVRGRDPGAFDVLVVDIQNAGTDNPSHFKNGCVKEGGYSLQQNPFEFAALVRLLVEVAEVAEGLARPPAGACVERYLEIGTASGGTMRFLNERLGFGFIAWMDDGLHHRAPEREAHIAAMIEGARFRPEVASFLGDSHADSAKIFLDVIRPGFDVAFIDGDHSYQGVTQDLELVLPHMRRGGYVLFHDIGACAGDVGRCWKEAVDAKKLRPVAELIGHEVPLGIAVGEVL